MNLIDVLLATDVEKLQEGINKDLEVTRLSMKLGTPFIISCGPLTSEQVTHIAEISKTSSDIKLNAILEACKIDGQKLKNEALNEKFGVATGKELLQKLFLVGEINTLYETVQELSGYGTDSVQEIKNS